MPFLSVPEIATECKVSAETAYKRLVSAGILAHPKKWKYEILPRGRNIAKWKYMRGKDVLVLDFDAVRSYVCVKHVYQD